VLVPARDAEVLADDDVVVADVPVGELQAYLGTQGALLA
jgi:hypothetical protein